MKNKEDLIADLHYIAGYALAIRQDLFDGEKPQLGFVNRMAELAEQVRKEFNTRKVETNP